MFEDYIQDAYGFFRMAEDCVDSDERQARMFYRAAVFCAASSLESFVNFVGDTFKKGQSLPATEIAFLNDLSLEVDPSKAEVESRTRYYSIDDKIKYLLKKFGADIDVRTHPAWQKFKNLKEFRDSLVHPREISDEVNIQIYRDRIREGLNANLDIMNSIAKKVFGKGLRTGVAELRL